jgi:hypothetical protein
MARCKILSTTPMPHHQYQSRPDHRNIPGQALISLALVSDASSESAAPGLSQRPSLSLSIRKIQVCINMDGFDTPARDCYKTQYRRQVDLVTVPECCINEANPL